MAAPVAAAVAVAAPATLSPTESASLQYMREEEKLAHDVYVTLYAKWGLRIFNNISTAEQRHTDAIVTLLNRYGINDPAAGNAVGVFTNPDLQALYDKLIAQGSISTAEALKVGVLIEQTDMQDLKTHIAETTKADILQVYNNLLARLAEPSACLQPLTWAGRPLSAHATCASGKYKPKKEERLRI